MWKLENREGSSEKGKFIGGYVQEPILGLHEDVYVYDLNSQYPNAMITFNISPDSFIGKTKHIDNDWIKTPTDCYFKKSFKGIIPIMLENLLIKRDSLKKQLKNYDKDSLEYKKLDNMQQIVKVILNGTFGCVGSNYSRYYSIDMAESITGSSQYIIKWLHNYLTLKGNIAIGSDTDSIFIKKNEN
jgi:DNA polymerase, archaea type